MNFEMVATLEELDSLDPQDVAEGYMSAERGDPEPGLNRGKAFWHGWCNRQRDYGLLPICSVQRNLVKQYIERGQLTNLEEPRG